MRGKKLGRISVFVLSLILTMTMIPSMALAYNSDVSNVNQLSQSDQINFRQNRLAATRAGNSSYGYYATGSDYLTTEGSYKYLYPITVANNEVLQAQVDMPNSSAINYDVYLYEVAANGDMTQVDYSVFSTYINGAAGTAPEAVGVYNTSGASKQYALFVKSRVGSSSTLPFTIHIGINANTEAAEADENAIHASKISLTDDCYAKVINTRAMNTACDNDWFYFDVNSTRNFDTIALSLDSTAIAAGFNLDVYTVVNTGLQEVPLVNGKLQNLSVARYFVRVSSVGCSAFDPSNYTLTIAPNYYADAIEISTVGDGDTAAYDGHTYSRVNGNSTVTVTGIARANGVNLPNTEVTIVIANPSWTADSQHFRRATVTTDSYGRFTAYIAIENAVGDNSTLVGSATKFRHYWDYGYVYGVDKDGYRITANVEKIYIFAYSTYVG